MSLALLVCALTQLCAAASKVCADFSHAGSTRRSGPQSDVSPRNALGGKRRCPFPRLTLLGVNGRLQLTQSWDDSDVNSTAAARADRVSTLASTDVVLTATTSASTPAFGSSRGNTYLSVRAPVLVPRRRNDDSELAAVLRRRGIVANSFLVVGGGAISAGLIAATRAYAANRSYAQKDSLERGDVERANAELARIQRTGTMAASLLGAGGAALLSGLALKLWNRKAHGSDTRAEGMLVAKPHKLGGMLAVRGTWGVAL